MKYIILFVFSIFFIGCTRHVDTVIVEKKVYIKPHFLQLKKIKVPEVIDIDVYNQTKIKRVSIDAKDFDKLVVYVNTLRNIAKAYEKEIDIYNEYQKTIQAKTTESK